MSNPLRDDTDIRARFPEMFPSASIHIQNSTFSKPTVIRNVNELVSRETTNLTLSSKKPETSWFHNVEKEIANLNDRVFKLEKIETKRKLDRADKVDLEIMKDLS